MTIGPAVFICTIIKNFIITKSHRSIFCNIVCKVLISINHLVQKDLAPLNINPNGNQSNLINPKDNDHILLLYEDDACRDNSVITYINEGLRKGQLCFYCTVKLEPETAERLRSDIIDYDHNVSNGNFRVMDFEPFYLSALKRDLAPFEKLKTDIMAAVKERKDSHVRLVGDAVTYLFRYMHFKEFEMLEKWWQNKPFKGSYLCPFSKSLIERLPHAAHEYALKHILHDVIVECPKIQRAP